MLTQVVFDHIPSGLKQADGCKDLECLTQSSGSLERITDTGLRFTGNINYSNDTKFKYHLNYISTNLDSAPYNPDTGLFESLGPVVTEFRGNFEQQISGVTAFDAGLKMTATPTTVDGRSATKMSFTSSNANVVLLGDKSTAQWVVASGKVPVLIEAGYPAIAGVAGINGSLDFINPLGMPSSTGTGYGLNYKASVLDATGAATVLESGVKSIADKAPVLTSLSTANTYVVGLTTPQLIGMSASDTDAGDKVTMAVEVKPKNGSVSIGDGRAVYTPNTGFYGTDTFSVLAIDSFGAVALKEATVNVVNGSAIASVIKADNLSGIAPFSAKLNVVTNNPDDAKNISRIEWQQSVAGTAEWKALSTSVTPSVLMKDPGEVTVRAMVYNKLSNLSFTTEPIRLSAVAAHMPNFKMRANLSTEFAPAFVGINLQPETPADQDLMRGRQYTYAWTFPEGMPGKGNGTTASVYLDQPGQHVISVTVTDAYKQSQTIEYVASLMEMKPFEFSITPKKILPFERAPMTYVLRTNLRLGHPRDHVKSYTLKVDGNVYGDAASRKLPTMIQGLQAGVHDIALSFETNYGVTGTATTQVTVTENQPPVCKVRSLPLGKTTSVIVLADCRDADGKVRALKWMVDGAEVVKSTPSLSLDMKDRASAVVSIRALDDSGVLGEAASITLSGTGAAKF